MDPLPPIPSPPGHLVREFCHRLLPILAFVAAALLTAVLWHHRLTGTLLFGEVEPVRFDVSSPDDGTIVEVFADRFDTVTNGQILATVQVVDADAARDSLAIVRSELDIMRSRLALDEARNEQNLESLRVRWLEARVDLATARVNLEIARRELARNRRLNAERIVSDSDLDLALANCQALEAEVSERSALVDGLDTAIARLSEGHRQDRGGNLETISRSLAAQERQLEHSRSRKLRAPADGQIRAVNLRPGERLAAGAVFATVTATRPQRIVSYVRLPLALDPKPGMPVEIRTRGPSRQVAHSHIVGVGRELELVLAPMRIRGLDSSQERGLPFFVALPPGLRVHPGELVDLVVQQNPQ